MGTRLSLLSSWSATESKWERGNLAECEWINVAGWVLTFPFVVVVLLLLLLLLLLFLLPLLLLLLLPTSDSFQV